MGEWEIFLRKRSEAIVLENLPVLKSKKEYQNTKSNCKEKHGKFRDFVTPKNQMNDS